MRVLVFGGTQGVGRLFAERASANGHRITLFARDPPAVEAWRTPSMRVVKGDARDRASVVAAVPGHDAVLMSLGPTGRERFQRFIGPATAGIVEAMEASGVPRLLYMSALGVGDSRRDAPATFRWFVAPLLLRTTFADRADGEAIVRQSRLDWTIVRPLWLSNDEPTGRWHATTNGRKVRDGIARSDVAAFLVEELPRRDHVRKAVAIEGA